MDFPFLSGTSPEQGRVLEVDHSRNFSELNISRIGGEGGGGLEVEYIQFQI